MNKELSKYTLRMQSKVSAISIDEYTVYAFSEDEAIRKLADGEFSGMVMPIECEPTNTGHDEALIDTIEVVSCESGTLS